MNKDQTIKGGATLWARQTIESEIFLDKPHVWFKIWFYLVNRVNHAENKNFKRGECFLKYDWIMEKTKSTKHQIDGFVRWAKKSQMLTTQKTTRGMIVFLPKYSHFQTLDNYYYDVKTDTKTETKTKQKRNKNETINKNDKNEENDKTTTNVVEAKPIFGNLEINWLLDEFERIMGMKSMGGKKDRFMAKHLLNNFSREQITAMLLYCAEGGRYVPSVGSVEKLWFKRADIVAGIRKFQGNKQHNVVSI
jgi:hypothetical protein